MMKLKPCIICYRLTSDADALLQPNNEGKKEALTRFFHFLGRHLDEDSETDGKVDNVQFPFEKVIHAGILTCVDCSLIIESFGKLYHDMKAIKLLLNWKVQTLKNIMLRAQRVPTRVREFRCSAEKMDIGDITADEIFDFKKNLVKRCCRRLEKSQPRLILNKYIPRQNESKHVTATSPTSLERGQPSPINIISGAEDDDDDPETISPVTETSQVTYNLKQDLKSTNLTKEVVFVNQDIVGDNDEDFSRKSTGDRAKEEKHPQNSTHPPIPDLFHEPEYKMGNVEPGKVPTTSRITRASTKLMLENSAIQTPRNNLSPPSLEQKSESLECSNTEKRSDYNLQNCTSGTVQPISKAISKRCAVPPPIIIPSKYPQLYEKLPTEVDSKSGMFKCTICIKEFKSSQSCRVHFDNEHLKLRFECSACAVRFHFGSTYYNHYKGTHMQTTRVKCDICRKEFNSATSLRHHVIRCHVNKRFQCHFCFKSFTQTGSRKLHMERHCLKASTIKSKSSSQSKINVPTQLCMGTFGVDYETTKKSEIHMPRSNPKKTCYFCNANFVHKSTLSTHKLICPKRPSTDSASVAKTNFGLANVTDMNNPAEIFILPDAMQEVHPVSPSPVGQLTEGDESNGANSVVNKGQHHNANSADKTCNTRKGIYRCSTCSKVFSQTGHLKRHFKAIHLQLREFACDLCDLKFKRKDNLDEHRREVHGNAKRKRQRQNLDLHLDRTVQNKV